MSKTEARWVERPDGYLDHTPILQFALVTLLFMMWAIAQSLNDILITQFKAVFDLSNFATAFVQTAFYGGYFVVAIPAALFVRKTSYRLGIIAGLAFFALGCFLFFPASRLITYQIFLFAIFIEAIGLSFLETSSNTYSTLLGPKRLGTLRLNISQVMNALGNIIGILLGKYLIFQDTNLHVKMQQMSHEAAAAYGAEQLGRTLEPYKWILVALAVLIVAFAVTKFPSGRPKTAEGAAVSAPIGETFRYLFHDKRYWGGVLTQFIYMGAQVGVWSYTMRLALDMFPRFSDRFVANFMLFSYGFFFIGRITASLLLSRFRETRVVIGFMTAGCLMLLGTTFIDNIIAVYLAVGASFCLAPGWPTIYSRTLETVEDRRYTETAGAIIVMGIVGGAILTAIQGALADVTSMQFSFILPAIYFAIVALYFLSEARFDKLTPRQKKELENRKVANPAPATVEVH